MRLSTPLRGISRLTADRTILRILLLSLLLNVVQWVYLIRYVKPQSFPIPLHYTITFGIDRIGPWYSAFILPISGTIMVMTNFLLSALTVEHHRMTTLLIAAISVLIESILLVSAILLIRIM